MIIISDLHIGAKRVAGTAAVGKPRRAAVPSAGDKFGKWTFLEETNKYKWAMRCACGVEREVRANTVRHGKSKSCGCAINKRPTCGEQLKHGADFSDKVYRTWRNVKTRIFNKKSATYKNYGARGVTMHQAWADSFEVFRDAVGNPPTEQHSLDRIDGNCGYVPGNVRWATASEQAMNRATCRLISIGGETRPLKDWCNRTGIKYELAQYRLKKGMPAEMVIDSNLKFDRKKGAYVSH